MKPKTKANHAQKADVSTSKHAEKLKIFLNATLQHASLSNPNVSIDGRTQQTFSAHQSREVAEAIRDIFEKFVDFEQDYNLMKFLETQQSSQRMVSHMQAHN